MAEREIKVVISAADEYADVYAKFKTDTQGVESSVTSSAGKMESGWKSSIDGIKNAWVGIAAVVASSAWLQSAAAEALEAETNLNKLRIQLEGIGKTYNSTVQNAVTAAANYARVQDDEVNKTLQELIFITGDADKSLKNLNITYDLSYQKGISASEAASLIGKAMTGNIEPLGRYMLEFKNINERLGEYATEAEKAAYAMAVLEEKTNGALAQMTEHEKKLKDLTNVYRDLKQGIGEVVLEMTHMIVMDLSLDAQKEKFGSLARSVGNLVDSLRYGTEAVQKMDAAIDTQIKLDAFSERAVTLVGNAHKKTADEIRAHIKALSDLKKYGSEITVDTSALTQSTSLTNPMDSFAAGLSDFKLSDELKAPLESLGGIWGEYLATGAKTSFETVMAATSANTKFDTTEELESSLDTAYSLQEKYINDVLNLNLKQYEQEQQLAQMRVQTVTSMASNMTNTMQALFVATGSNNKAMFNAYKVFAVSEALIDTYLAINKTIAQGGWYAIPLAITVGAMGFANAAAIASQEMTGSASSSTTTSTGETITTGSTDTSSASLVAESSSSSSTPTQYITVNIQNGSGSGEYWQDIVENNIIPAINDASDRNIEITINRA